MGDKPSEESLIQFATRSLNQGVSEADIRQYFLAHGASVQEANRLIEAADKDIKEWRAAAVNAQIISGLCLLAFGAVILAIAVYLSSVEIPSGRQGRLLIGYLLGGGSLLYGFWLLVTLPKT